VRQGERLVCAGFEVRIIAVPREEEPGRLRTLELPDWMAEQFGVRPEARI
jgi:hypothetical protein